jgi:hypothetical protein
MHPSSSSSIVRKTPRTEASIDATEISIVSVRNPRVHRCPHISPFSFRSSVTKFVRLWHRMLHVLSIRSLFMSSVCGILPIRHCFPRTRPPSVTLGLPLRPPSPLPTPLLRHVPFVASRPRDRITRRGTCIASDQVVSQAPQPRMSHACDAATTDGPPAVPSACRRWGGKTFMASATSADEGQSIRTSNGFAVTEDVESTQAGNKPIRLRQLDNDASVDSSIGG